MIGHPEKSRLVRAIEALSVAADCHAAASMLVWYDTSENMREYTKERREVLQKAALEFAAAVAEEESDGELLVVQGLNASRRKREPEEENFARAWEAQTHLLNYLLATENNRPVQPSRREQVVAATVIQWLGSSVGQSFLADLGYLKTLPGTEPERRQKSKLPTAKRKGRARPK